MSSNFDSEKVRLESFQNWPHPDEASCSKGNMAKAGFYYLGQADCVKCFACHIKLRDWKNDEPWTKHEGNCSFASLRKEENLLSLNELIVICREMATNRLDKKYHKFDRIFKDNI